MIANLIGWIGNIAFGYGVYSLAKKRIYGFYFNVFGNCCYIAQGILLKTSSLYILSIFLVMINLFGVYEWNKKNGT